MKFAWLWALLALIGAPLLLNEGGESLGFFFGRAAAGLIAAALMSPVIWLVSRSFTKIKWQWFHWLNAICFAALAWQIVLSIAGPKIAELTRRELQARAAAPSWPTDTRAAVPTATAMAVAADAAATTQTIAPVVAEATADAQAAADAAADAAIAAAEAAAAVPLPETNDISVAAVPSEYIESYKKNFTLLCSNEMSSGDDAMPLDFSMMACACAAETMTSTLDVRRLKEIDSNPALALTEVPKFVTPCVESEFQKYVDSHPGFLRDYVLKHPEILD